MTGTVRELSVSPICLREFDVLRVWDVTPGMRRVVLGGPAIGEHVRDGVRIPAVQTTGFDDDVKIMPPDPVTGGFPFEVPRNTTTGLVEWTPGSFEYTRTYTVRSFDAEAGELAIDFALHESGLASTWARRTTPGEKILVAGPKHSAGLPTAADWMLIGGDETALPAIGHCLEKLPQTLPATVVIEVADPSHRQELSSAAPVDIIWLYRSETGGRSRLAETIQSVRWRDGQVYLWVAGETLTVKPLRRWAKRDKGIPKEFTDISGYWRERRVTTVEGDPQLVDVSAAGRDPFEAIHEYSEVLPPFALRAAVTLGVFTEIDAGATTAQDIAAACGVRAEPLLKLVRHLAAMGLLLRDGETFSLTEEGVVLADPDAPWVEELRVDSVQSQMQLSFVDLVDVIRTGRPVGSAGCRFPPGKKIRCGRVSCTARWSSGRSTWHRRCPVRSRSTVSAPWPWPEKAAARTSTRSCERFRRLTSASWVFRLSRSACSVTLRPSADRRSGASQAVTLRRCRTRWICCWRRASSRICRTMTRSSRWPRMRGRRTGW